MSFIYGKQYRSNDHGWLGSSPRSIHPIFWYILVDVSTYSCLNHVLETLCCFGIVDVRFIFYPNSKENRRTASHLSFFRDYSIFDKGPKPTPSQTSLFLFFSIRALMILSRIKSFTFRDKALDSGWHFEEELSISCHDTA